MTLSRRNWVQLVGSLCLPISLGAEAAKVSLRDRIAGLLYGSAIGDALGGPVEFQPREAVRQLPNPPKAWQAGERLDAAAKAEARSRLIMRPYAPLRPFSEPYGQWGDPAPAGTITDDTRHKLVFLDSLHRTGGPPNAKTLAQVYMGWPTKPLPGAWKAMNADWLEEWRYASAWVLGERDPSKARPPERMWQGLPTCCGQMTSLPVAALYPGEPAKAYQSCYQLSYFDNGFGKDLNAALVAGLASALSGATWPEILASIRKTDPYRYGDIRYTERQVDRWLNIALKLVKEAKGEPAVLFDALEKLFAETIKWEAQVPFVVAFACLALADYDPLTALQLSIEWGHDTDSYASLVGAYIGAVHGVGLFPDSLVKPVHERLLADFEVDLSKEADFLLKLQG